MYSNELKNMYQMYFCLCSSTHAIEPDIEIPVKSSGICSVLSEQPQTIPPIQKAYHQTYFLQNDNYDVVSRHVGGSLDIIDKHGNFVKNLYYRDESNKDSHFPDATLFFVKNELRYSILGADNIVWCMQFPTMETIQKESLLERLLSV